jgi:beta-glucosidase
MTRISFPDGFLWGASTSSHQIEGGDTYSDWCRFEEAGHAPVSGCAADSWNRWRDDLDVAVELGLNVFRISVEWARIEPTEGHYDREAMSHYTAVLAEARRRGLKTMVVLWHFTNPEWVAHSGGWTSRQTAEKFAAYARQMAVHLGHLVDYWVTLNEADTFVWKGYIARRWPPMRKNAWPAAYAAYRNLARAHKRARAAIREVLGGDQPVGLTHMFIWTHPAEKGGLFSARVVARLNFLANDLFMGLIASDVDWLGVQYYVDCPARFSGIALDDGDPPTTDMGWRIAPRGIYEVVMRAWKRLGIPIMVTENGLADASDSQRARFIIDHLAWLNKAMRDGADVRGYLHWSLIDNFEWCHGTEPRFGLAEVDFETFERKIRPSARVYARIIGGNGFDRDFGSEYTYADGTPSLAPAD